jgi:WS/DGAT/MGAT family acyltransferase
MKTEFFSPVDAAWLHMDKPSNLAMIAGVMMFETPVEFERLRDLIEERLLIYERFRQRVKEPLLGLGLPQWETVPRLDMGYHLKRVTLAAPGDEAALQALAGELMSLPLDRRHPLWQFHFVDGYGAGTAVIARLHHCIADGLALVQVLLSMTDTSPEPVKPTTQAAAHHAASPLENLFAPVNRLVATTVTTAESLLQAGLLTPANPRRLIDAAKIGALGALAASKLMLLNPDRQTLFKGQCGVTKRAVWSKPIKLAEVKTLAHALHGTVNDVLLAAVTGALRRYLDKHLPGVEVPVSPVIVFGSDKAEVDAGESPIPAMHAKKLKDWLRGPGKAGALKPDVRNQLIQLLEPPTVQSQLVAEEK